MARPAAGTPPARDRIVGTAGRLFYEKGIHQVGINEVIEASGVARMTLYHHFASKDALVEAVLVDRRAGRMGEIETALARFSDPCKKVLAVFDLLAATVKAAGYRGCAFINAAVDRADADDAAHSLAAAYKRELAGRFEAIARAARWRRPARLAMQILLLWDGAAVEAYLQRSDAPVRAARAAVASLIDAAGR